MRQARLVVVAVAVLLLGLSVVGVSPAAAAGCDRGDTEYGFA